VLGWLRTVKALKGKYTDEALWRAVMQSLGDKFYFFTQGTGDMPSTVDEVIAEVEHRYDFKDSEHAESTLRAMTQKTNESTVDFIVRAVQVARKAIRRPGDEDRMVRVIIDGCRQPAKGYLLLKEPPPRSFRDLETFARNHDLAFGHATGSGGIPVHSAEAVQPTQGGGGSAQDDTLAVAVAKVRRLKKQKKAGGPTRADNYLAKLPETIQVAVANAVPPPGPCPHCGSNHWASACPANPRRTGNAVPRQQPANQYQQQQSLSSQQQPAAQGQQQSTTTGKVKPPFNPDVVCTKCMRLGHAVNDCWVVQCFHCNSHGHHASKCPFLATQAPSQVRPAAPAQVAQAPARVQQSAFQQQAVTAAPATVSSEEQTVFRAGRD
jgi:hypothetical protein